MNNQGDAWAWAGLVVIIAMGITALACWVDDWWTARGDRAQDRREGWTEPPSRLDTLDWPERDELWP